MEVFLFQTHTQKITNSPWEPVLSMKLLRLNKEVLEAKYWINLCRDVKRTNLVWFVYIYTVSFYDKSHRSMQEQAFYFYSKYSIYVCVYLTATSYKRYKAEKGTSLP